MKTVQWNQLGRAEQRQLLTRPAIRDAGAIDAQAATIIEQVQRDGDTALSELTARFDGVTLDDFQVRDAEFAWAAAALTQEQHDAIASAAANIAEFHQAQRPGDIAVNTAAGVTCAEGQVPRHGDRNA